jgi:hypothetical protein
VARGTEYPCPGCGRVVAYASARQYIGGFEGRGGGKARRPHRCPHGTACTFGSRFGGHGMNHSACAECRAERKAERERAAG